MTEPIVYQMPTEMQILEAPPSEAVPAVQEAAPAVPSDQHEIVSALLAAHVGLGLVHHLAVETFQREEERQIPPRTPKEDEPK